MTSPNVTVNRLSPADRLMYYTYMEKLTTSNVYVILVRGNDYYDQLAFHSVYTTQEAAEAKAAELRLAVDEFGLDEGDLEFDQVVVIASALND